MHTAAFILPAFLLAVIVNLPKVTTILLQNLKYLAVLVMHEVIDRDHKCTHFVVEYQENIIPQEDPHFVDEYEILGSDHYFLFCC